MDTIDQHMYRLLSVATALLLTIGVLFYHFFEKFSWVNAWYFCICTLATVGYGDIVPKTDAGKLFTTAYIIVGVGILTAFITTTVKRRGNIARERYESSVKSNQTDRPN